MIFHCYAQYFSLNHLIFKTINKIIGFSANYHHQGHDMSFKSGQFELNRGFQTDKRLNSPSIKCIVCTLTHTIILNRVCVYALVVQSHII